MEGRVPPHSAEAEKSVLGAAMLSKDALFDVMEVVKPADFYDENHKEIFQAMIDLNRKNAPVDALTVAEELKKRNSLDGGWQSIYRIFVLHDADHIQCHGVRQDRGRKGFCAPAYRNGG